jgi:cell division protein FtsW
LAKIVIVIYLAVWLYAKGDKIKQVGFGLIPLALILGLVGGLIAIQTDVSAAVTVFALGMLLFYMSGGSLVQIWRMVWGRPRERYCKIGTAACPSHR